MNGSVFVVTVRYFKRKRDRVAGVPAIRCDVAPCRFLRQLFKDCPKASHRNGTIASVRSRLRSRPINLFRAVDSRAPPFKNGLLDFSFMLESLLRSLSERRVNSARACAIRNFRVNNGPFKDCDTGRPVPRDPKADFLCK